MALSFPQNFKIVEGLVPQVGTAAVVTSDYVSLKNAVKAWIVIHYNQGDGDNQQWNVLRATAVAPTNSAVIATAVPIWSNLDCVTSDTLVRRTAAVNYQSGVGQTHKQIVFEIDPASLGATAGNVPYDCIAVASNGNIAATSTVEVMFYLETSYAQATPPSAIVD